MSGPATIENKDDFNLNRTKTLLAALALAAPDSGRHRRLWRRRRDPTRIPQEILEAAFNNDTTIESGVIDLSFDLSRRGRRGRQPRPRTSPGPFASDPENPTGIGQLDLDVTVSGEGAAAEALGDFEAGVTVTEDNLYVNYNGTDYELGEEAFAQLKEQQEAAAGDDRRGRVSSFTRGLRAGDRGAGRRRRRVRHRRHRLVLELENEGTEDVGGAEATHVSGSLDVEQMVTDLFAARRLGPRRDGRRRSRR